MLLLNLELINIRNYEKSKFHFSPNTTIVIGPNAAGKTNLLEAIFLLATGKSFRAESDREIIGFGKEIGRVRGKITQSDDHEEIELEMVLTQGEVMGVTTPIKKYLVNGVGKRMLDFTGKLKIALFWPQDMELVTNAPSLRRRYLDFVLLQTDREYRRTLISYEKGLRQRNKLLEAIRERGAHRHQLMFWDQLLIKNGEYITKKREEYIDFINKFQNPIRQLADKNLSPRLIGLGPKNYQLEYDKSVISRLRLDQYSEEEIAAGVTLVGPHRDDFKFKIKDEELRDLSHFGSRGEQRLAILWLKLGELSYIEEQTNEKPVLLLDDILSELDHEHRQLIFAIMGHQQTIMTTTDQHFIEKNKLKDYQLVEL